MEMRHFIRVLALVLLLVGGDAAPALAQNAELKACLARVEARDAAQFLVFDRELRAALSSVDATSLALLASYPLRVNDGGTVLIADAKTLALKVATVFPPALRAAVNATAIDDVICSTTAIGYGHGALWVVVQEQFGGERFAIGTVNLPGTSTADAGAIRFVCRADDQRVAITRDAAGRLQYQAWMRPRSLTDAPDVSIRDGREEVDGRGVCVRRFWTFKNDAATYEIGEIACAPDTPPDGVAGELRVIVDGIEKKQSWCY